MEEGKEREKYINLAKSLQGANVMLSVLIHLGCGNRNTIDWVACRQQKFIFHSLGGSERASLFIGPFHRGTNPIHEGFSLIT